MDDKKINIPANQDEVTLYCFVGEAICKIQHVEQALSCSITIKMNPFETREKADKILEEFRSYTLGKAITLATKENLSHSDLLEKLNNFLLKRNWLVHKAIFEIHECIYGNSKTEELLKKIKSISDSAENIQQEIEYDMINFCTAQGRDMSNIKSMLEQQKRGIRIKSTDFS